MAQVGPQRDAGAHQSQAEQRLQGQPGEVEQRPHVGAVQLHEGVLRGREEGGKERGLETESRPPLFAFTREIFMETLGPWQAPERNSSE